MNIVIRHRESQNTILDEIGYNSLRFIQIRFTGYGEVEAPHEVQTVR